MSRSSAPQVRVVRDRLPVASRDAGRKVPPTLMLRLLFGLEWAGAAFLMVFVLATLPNIELVPASYDRTTRGTIVAVEDSGSYELGTVYRVRYTFVDEHGVEHAGSSYAKHDGLRGEVTVEYLAEDPDTSRVAGLRARELAPPQGLIVLLPLVSLVPALARFRKGLRAIRILRWGLATGGRLVDEKHEVTQDDTTLQRLTFEYAIHAGDPRRTTLEIEESERLEDEELEPLLYDPRAPDQALVLAYLPGSPRVTDNELDVEPGRTAHLVLFPLLTLGLVIATIIAMVR